MLIIGTVTEQKLYWVSVKVFLFNLNVDISSNFCCRNNFDYTSYVPVKYKSLCVDEIYIAVTKSCTLFIVPDDENRATFRRIVFQLQ